ncbi:MAG: hypothetical protein MUF00_18630 [Gemmatimonadaceae bacterium]|nr:hypothetical protein [Gemmatimonadaceae bacterium]
MIATRRAALLALLAAPLLLGAHRAPALAAKPFTVEYLYKIRWGHQEEWMALYKRNHYPILVRQQQMGRIVRMSAVMPMNHAGEADRWDLRFTITWKDAETAHDDFDSSVIAKELYPDQARFAAEEQRRFQLLEAHTDVPIVEDDLATWKKTP